jgi:hypothetical protein
MTDLTPEEQARLDRVASAEEVRLQADADAERKAAERREYNRVKKAEQRQREKEARQRELESSPGYREALTKENAEASARRQMKDRREREGLILSELTDPILPDEPLEGSEGKSYWLDYFLPELEIYIDEVRRFSCGDWEKFYRELSLTPVGRLVLQYYGVEPFPLPPDSKLSCGYIVTPTAHLIDFPRSDADSERIAALKQVWDAGRKARQGWKP